MKFVAIAPAFLTCLLMLTLAGCGSSSRLAAHVQPGSGQPTATPLSRPTSTAAASSQSSVAGHVTLTLNKALYAPEDPFLVTIHNGLNHAIWVQDQRSGCTSLTVEHNIGGEWDTVGQCVLTRPARTIAIAAGASLSQRIDFAQGMDTGSGWPAGTYRVTLAYAVGQQASTSATSSDNMAQSAAFSVQ